MQNPFTLTFGKSPLEPVERPVQTNEIIEAFTADPINQQIFIITGVRGSGKTVMMTEISHRLRKKEDWVVIELNPATDLLQGMLSKLNSNQVCAGMIKSAKIDLSFFGFGVSIEGAIFFPLICAKVMPQPISMPKRFKMILSPSVWVKPKIGRASCRERV